jgi:hypothetical protein
LFCVETTGLDLVLYLYGSSFSKALGTTKGLATLTSLLIS